MSLERLGDATEMLTYVLSLVVNIRNPNELWSDDNTTTKELKCHNCEFVPNALFQTATGSLVCLNCLVRSPKGVKIFHDKRLQEKILSIETKCHLHKEGCKWKGNVNAYAHHILENCVFAKMMCDHCEEIVHIKNIEFHKQTENCKNYETVKIKCCFDCGYIDNVLLMKMHIFDKCPKLKELKLLQNDNAKDSTGHISNTLQDVLVPFNYQCNEMIGITIHQLEQRRDHNFDVFLQNELHTRLSMIHDRKSNYHHVCLTTIQNHHIRSVVETLKKTKVIMTVVNKKKMYPDHATRDFKFVLPFQFNNTGHCYFYKMYALKGKDMPSNSETKTCYLDAHGLDLKIDIRYPNKFPMF